MTILPLYAAPQYAPQVTDWLWQAFGGETLPRQFFASIVQHSQTAEALPLTFIAVEGEQLLGTIGLWRCDLISRQDLFPWLAALYVAPAARGQGLAGAVVTEGIRPGVICLHEGAWPDLDPQVGICKNGAVNVLTKDIPTSRLGNGCAGNTALAWLEKYTGPALPLTAFDPPANA